MNQTTTALIVKFVMTLLAAGIAFIGFNNNLWSWVLLVAFVGTALNYLLGDLFVLPKYGNVTASIGDGILAALVAYLVDVAVPAFATTFTSLAVFAVIVAVAEYFFHGYLRRSEKVEP